MTAALALLISAAVMSWLAPRWLRRAEARHRDPVVVLAGWLLSLTSVLVAVVLAAAMLIMPDHRPLATLVAAFSTCWSALAHGSSPHVEGAVGQAALGGLAVLAVITVVLGVRKVRRAVRTGRAHLAVLRLAARPDTDESPTTLWLALDKPFAFCVAGRPGMVIATDGLHRQLPRTAVAAVLAHERAHLRGRHHLLITLVDTLRAVLPFVPMFAQAPVAVRRLVELAADAAAARACGVDAVRCALRQVGSHDVPEGALAMGAQELEARLGYLTAGVTGELRRSVACSVVAMTALVGPLLTGTALLAVVGVVGCHTAGS